MPAGLRGRVEAGPGGGRGPQCGPVRVATALAGLTSDHSKAVGLVT
jgi:hypothetical protein